MAKKKQRKKTKEEPVKENKEPKEIVKVVNAFMINEMVITEDTDEAR